jgi:hypothetical protein
LADIWAKFLNLGDIFGVGRIFHENNRPVIWAQLFFL